MIRKLVTAVSTLAFTGIVATALLVPPTVPTMAHGARIGLCGRWAREIRAEHDDARMHTLGCSEPRGAWVRGSGHCMIVAYHYAATRSSGAYDFAHVGRMGCVLMEDGSWSTE